MDLYSIGEMLIDFTPGDEANSYVRNPGGAPANVAVATSRNGLDVGMNCMVGDDDFGHFLLDTLRNNKVSCINSRICTEAITTLAFVTLKEGGERSFTFARKPGADMFISEEDVKKEDIAGAVIVHGGSLALSASPSDKATLKALSLAHEMGKIVSFDVNYRDMLWNFDKEACGKRVKECLPFIDILKVSDEEVDIVGGEDFIPNLMKEYDLSVVIETLGPHGARGYLKDGSVVGTEGRKADAVDGTGAGDAFLGGFLSKLRFEGVDKSADLTEEIVHEALIYGNTAGWLCVQQKGGIPSLPYRDKIESYL